MGKLIDHLKCFYENKASLILGVSTLTLLGLTIYEALSNKPSQAKAFGVLTYLSFDFFVGNHFSTYNSYRQALNRIDRGSGLNAFFVEEKKKEYCPRTGMNLALRERDLATVA
jgi:hypothetical protein